MKSTLVNMVSVLGTITLVSAAAVSGFYLLTKDAIDVANRNKVNKAISEVVSGFDNAPSDEVFRFPAGKGYEGDTLLVYPAKKDGNVIGYAVSTFSSKGYGGKIELMVGVLSDGRINAVSVVSEAETPGLGHKMSTDTVLTSQFRNIDPASKTLKVKKGDGGDIDAITAATISSRAFCDAVNRALSVTDGIMHKSSTDAASGATKIEKSNGEDKK